MNLEDYDDFDLMTKKSMEVTYENENTENGIMLFIYRKSMCLCMLFRSLCIVHKT